MKKNNAIKGAYLVSHKCYERVRALRFEKNRKWYVEQLRVMAKKHNVPILTYLVARDGIYFICAAVDPVKISKMMQVLQSSASKEFAGKRGGESSMWRGRFNTTFIHGDVWVKQSMLLLDLHMTATKHIIHPAEWNHCGWKELAGTKKRYRVISTEHAWNVWGDNTGDDVISRVTYVNTVEACCQENSFGCLETWADALAIGDTEWVKYVGNSIPVSFKHINILPYSASPISTGELQAATLTVSKKDVEDIGM